MRLSVLLTRLGYFKLFLFLVGFFVFFSFLGGRVFAVDCTDEARNILIDTYPKMDSELCFSSTSCKNSSNNKLDECCAVKYESVRSNPLADWHITDVTLALCAMDSNNNNNCKINDSDFSNNSWVNFDNGVGMDTALSSCNGSPDAKPLGDHSGCAQSHPDILCDPGFAGVAFESGLLGGNDYVGYKCVSLEKSYEGKGPCCAVNGKLCDASPEAPDYPGDVCCSELLGQDPVMQCIDGVNETGRYCAICATEEYPPNPPVDGTILVYCNLDEGIYCCQPSGTGPEDPTLQCDNYILSSTGVENTGCGFYANTSCDAQDSACAGCPIQQGTNRLKNGYLCADNDDCASNKCEKGPGNTKVCVPISNGSLCYSDCQCDDGVTCGVAGDGEKRCGGENCIEPLITWPYQHSAECDPDGLPCCSVDGYAYDCLPDPSNTDTYICTAGDECADRCENIENTFLVDSDEAAEVPCCTPGDENRNLTPPEASQECNSPNLGHYCIESRCIIYWDDCRNDDDRCCHDESGFVCVDGSCVPPDNGECEGTECCRAPGYVCNGQGDCVPDTTGRCVPTVQVAPYTGPPIEFSELLSSIYRLLYPVTLFIGAFLIGKSGYKLMTSEGDPRKVKEGQEELTSAILGSFFILLSVVILRVIISGILGALVNF